MNKKAPLPALLPLFPELCFRTLCKYFMATHIRVVGMHMSLSNVNAKPAALQSRSLFAVRPQGCASVPPSETWYGSRACRMQQLQRYLFASPLVCV